MSKSNGHHSLTPQMIDVDLITPSPYQPRRHFPETEMNELAVSIQEHNLLQPILVRPVTGGKYQLVAGERRWRAVKENLRWQQIPAIVRTMNATQAGVIALVENGQREDPDDWGTALAMRKLMTDGSLSEQRLAREIGKSVGYVRNFIGLFKLKPDVQEMVQRNEHVRSAAFEINKLPDKEIRNELIAAVDKGAAFKEIKSRVDSVLSDARWQKQSHTPDKFTRQAIEAKEKPRETARREVESAINELRRHAANLKEWMPETDANTRSKTRTELRGIVATLKEI